MPPWYDGAAGVEAYRALGISGLIVEMPAPIDDETLHRLAEEVRPRVDAG